MYTIESLRVQFPPLGAYTFAVGFGFDTPVLAAGLFIFVSATQSRTRTIDGDWSLAGPSMYVLTFGEEIFKITARWRLTVFLAWCNLIFI